MKRSGLNPNHEHQQIIISTVRSAAGAPRRGLQYPGFSETELAPPCRTETLMQGALANIQKLCDFHASM
jgi:hypothetical protein